jgi:hypothetical protein
MLHPNFGEFIFRNCLENRDGLRNRGSGGRKVGPKEPRSAAFCRPRSSPEGPSTIFQTVSPRTSVNRGNKRKGRSCFAPALPLAYTQSNAAAPLGSPLGGSLTGRRAARCRPLPLSPRALRPPLPPQFPLLRPCGCAPPPLQQDASPQRPLPL